MRLRDWHRNERTQLRSFHSLKVRATNVCYQFIKLNQFDFFFRQSGVRYCPAAFYRAQSSIKLFGVRTNQCESGIFLQ